ncbi:acetyl-CoA hydrolase/transferase C-terminal domain-containing protein [Elongatibacter sediminis]|uniref:Acetyl-CoA hydrolase/transferase C-terminal domain-containing protein n=1 Tax=Elongatibacter sediminis TaxID=3119006 RepID=A0AAW9RGN5_9GAMM
MKPLVTAKLDEFVAFVRGRLGDHWVVGAPLGLGKPNHLVNALYRAAKSDPSIRLELFTALSLNPPKPAQGLKQRFLGPFVERHFGGYPLLDYIADLDAGAVPENIVISEFYLRSGSRLGDRHIQRHYVSSNYTHVARDMAARGVNLLVQMVATRSDRPDDFSLSCNPDVTLDLLRLLPREHLMVAVQPNPDLPYMTGDAEVAADTFDIIVEDQAQRLFAVPHMPVSDTDYLIGLHASQLIRDGGTLQLGIGSLGDAVSFFTAMRHGDNPAYRKLLADSDADQRVGRELREEWGGEAPFEIGLYAASEMFTEGFLHLYRAGILRRRVYDHVGIQGLLNRRLIAERLRADTFDVLWREGMVPVCLTDSDLGWLADFGLLDPQVRCAAETLEFPDGGTVPNDLSQPEVRQALGRHAENRELKGGAVLHAAFFLGSQWMYDTLNALTDAEREEFRMTAVSRINQLYRGEALDRAQRLEARLVNSTMKMTLLGAAVSDQLRDGQVVSGVGGQYNFVAMAHALDRSRSLLMLRSFRGHGSEAVSNIVWEYPHATIPRHLRDLVVTEYGVADLRSANDEECIRRLICLADNRWQEALRTEAVAAGKLDPHWRVPAPYCENSPTWVRGVTAAWRARGQLSDYPFGSDFTPEEEQLTRALAWLQSHSRNWRARARLVFSAIASAGKASEESHVLLRRMGLERSSGPGDWLDRRLLLVAIRSTIQSGSNAQASDEP